MLSMALQGIYLDIFPASLVEMVFEIKELLNHRGGESPHDIA
jgi:hypothetical protein